VHIVYLRSSEDGPALALQENAIKDYMYVHGIEPDRTHVDTASLGALLDERTEFRHFIHSLDRGDTIYVYDLSVISHRIGELVQFCNCLFEHGLRLVVVRYAITIDETTPAKTLVQLLHSIQEENRRNGKMGRPKGSISKSKYDRYRDRIVQMIKEGKSVSEIAKELGVSRSSIRDYIVSRNLKRVAQGSGPLVQQLPKRSCQIDERIANGNSNNP